MQHEQRPSCSHEDLNESIQKLTNMTLEIYQAIFGNEKLKQDGLLKKVDDMYPVFVNVRGAKITLYFLVGAIAALVALSKGIDWVKNLGH